VANKKGGKLAPSSAIIYLRTVTGALNGGLFDPSGYDERKQVKGV